MNPDTDTAAGPAPDRAAALALLEAVDPEAYARTRNHVDGAVTGLSPWITHGVLDPPEVLAAVRRRHRVAPDHRLVMELAWREFFQHVWRHRGEAILADLGPPPGRGPRVARLPADVAGAATGVPVVDASVRQLYATGALHNHQRLWLASYLVHLRKVHWRAGADWMLGHLLDGDLGSNHLSWQWCAGTFATKPYLFDAANVARFAPRLASPGTVLDRSRAALEALALGEADCGPEPGASEPLAAPRLESLPPGRPRDPDLPGLPSRPGRVFLMHPWSLRRPPQADHVVGVVHAPFHARFPWSERRWRFVLSAMDRLADQVWLGDLHHLGPALAGAASLHARATWHPGYREALEALGVQVEPVPRITADPGEPCRSFSAFWRRVASSVAPG